MMFHENGWVKADCGHLVHPDDLCTVIREDLEISLCPGCSKENLLIETETNNGMGFRKLLDERTDRYREE